MAEQQFEGTSVVDHQAKLPSITVDCDYYPAGTVLRLAVEVRVKGVGYEEDKEGNFIRQHKLGIQDIEVVSSYNPAEAQDQVGGALASGAPDPDADTGLDVGRTADQWPSGIATDPNTGVRYDTSTGEVVDDGGDDDVDEPVSAGATSDVGF